MNISYKFPFKQISQTRYKVCINEYLDQYFALTFDKCDPTYYKGTSTLKDKPCLETVITKYRKTALTI